MTPDLKEQVALVTGAGRGIGRAIAIALSKCGAHVYLAARTQSELTSVAEQIRAANGQASVLPMDLAEESHIQRGFEQIKQLSRRLDIVINNAGIGVFGPVDGFPTAGLDQMLAINVRGTFLCCREALKLMIPARSGYIINISSVVGFKGYASQAAYTATKHAVLGLTKSLAQECQPQNIRVSAILPGGVDTDMVAASRPDLSRENLMSTDDIASSVLYLLSQSGTNAAVDQIYIRRKSSPPF